MGRNGQPIEILQAKGKSHHLTKAEIAKRKAAQIKSGNKTFKASEQVMADQVALTKFKNLKKLFREIEFIDGLDENIINRYCITYSQLQSLLDYKIKHATALEGLVMFDEMLKLDARIDKKQDLLIKMEDRLFLNPVSRMKNVPKKEEKKADPLADMGYGNV